MYFTLPLLLIHDKPNYSGVPSISLFKVKINHGITGYLKAKNQF